MTDKIMDIRMILNVKGIFMKYSTRRSSLSILISAFLIFVVSETAIAQPKTIALPPHDSLVTLVESYAKPKNLYVSSVRCIRPTDGSNEDQIRLEVYDNSGGRYMKDYSRTYKMKAGDVLGPILSTNVKAGRVRLVERDSFSADDLIGSFSYDKTLVAGRYVKRLSGDGGEYEVTIEIRPYHSVEEGGMGKVAN